MFRFQACRFKQDEHWKENCARFWAQEQGIRYTYCLECSQQGYYSTEVEPGKRVLIEFNPLNLQLLGVKLGDSIYQFANMIDQKEKHR